MLEWTNSNRSHYIIYNNLVYHTKNELLRHNRNIVHDQNFYGGWGVDGEGGSSEGCLMWGGGGH